MKITISFDLESDADEANMAQWLCGVLTGEASVIKKARKPRKPMTDEEKKAFRARMVKGQEAKAKREAAEAKGKELAKGSKSAAATKSKRSTSRRKKPVKDAA